LLFLPPAPESDSDFRLAPGNFTKLENLIFNLQNFAVDRGTAYRDEILGSLRGYATFAEQSGVG
jgi:hypothetical protein